MKIHENYLTKNQFSRPGRPLIGIKGIVLHWVENPMTTAEQNRNYFERLKLQDQNTTDELKYGSAHFIIGLQGEIIQCLLEDEMGYHVGGIIYTPRALKELSDYPNNCTLGIELCHINWAGEFTDSTLRSARLLILELCERYGLGRNNIYRHYDITKKGCPRYFVNNEDQWLNFLEKTFSKS
jgi:N-acetylmuramoyl-L-alanine amidase